MLETIVDIIAEFIRPVGNLFVRYVLPKGSVDTDSEISTLIGGLLVILIVATSIYILFKYS